MGATRKASENGETTESPYSNQRGAVPVPVCNATFSRGAAHGCFGNELGTNLSSGQPPNQLPTGEPPLSEHQVHGQRAWLNTELDGILLFPSQPHDLCCSAPSLGMHLPENFRMQCFLGSCSLGPLPVSPLQQQPHLQLSNPIISPSILPNFRGIKHQSRWQKLRKITQHLPFPSHPASQFRLKRNPISQIQFKLGCKSGKMDYAKCLTSTAQCECGIELGRGTKCLYLWVYK